MNIIEKFRGILVSHVHNNGKKYNGLSDLRIAVSNEWAKMLLLIFNNLLESMP